LGTTRQRNDGFPGKLDELIGDHLGRRPGPDDADTPFVELGANSLMMMEISRSIQRAFATHIPPRRLMGDLSTLNALAEHLDAEIQADPAPPEETASAETIRTVRSTPLPPAKDDSAYGDVFTTQIRAVRKALEAVVAEQLAFLRDQGVAPPLVERIVAETAAPASSREAAKPEKAASSVLPPWKAAEIRARGLSPAQQAHLEGFAERFTARTGGSKRLTQANRRLLADNRASAGFRFSLKEILYPLHGARARGAALWDVDDNEYVDITMGFGVNLFGHHPDFIVEAMERQLDQGIQIGPQTALAGEVAERFTRLTGKDRVAFFNTGSEAVMIALRLARAATGRNKVALFAGSYHGQADSVLGTPDEGGTVPLAPGITQGTVDDLLILEYGTPESAEAIRAHAHELAAVLVEPVQSRRPDLQPQDFLHEIREITREAGVPLIFDEMITGFRLHPQGAQGWYGVEADIATYGKVIGGGLPIGVVAGSAKYMDAFDGGFWQYGDASYPAVDTIFSAGTFNKHPLTLAAAKAVLDHLEAEGPALQETLNARTAKMAGRLNGMFDSAGAPIKVLHCGSQFRFATEGNLELFFHHLLEHGIFVWEGRNCFLSTAHTDADIDHIVEAARAALEHLRGGGFLPAKDEPRRLPLLESQRQLALLADIDADGSRAYTVSAVFDLKGPLDTDGLKQALEAVIGRHDALRTEIGPDGWTQRILPTVRLTMAVEDVANEDAARAKLAEEAEVPFDLQGGPLFRARLIRLGDDRHWLALTCHHIVSDGLSMAVIVDELGTLLAAKPAADLPPAPPFSEFVQWHLCERPGETMRGHEAFWRAELETPPETLHLPYDHPRPATRSFRGARCHRRLPEGLVERIDETARGKGATRFMALLAAHLFHLHRLTGQDDIVIGIPVSGREGGDWGRMAGYCTHLLPLRSRFEDGLDFNGFLIRTKAALLAAYEHEDYPFARLITRLGLARDAAQPPLIASVFNIDRPLAPLGFGDLAVELVDRPIRFTAYDLALNVLETEDAVSFEADFNTDLFDGATVEALLDRYLAVLESATRTPDQPLSEIRLLTGAEAERQLADWGNGGPARDKTTVPALFAATAKANGGKTAAIDGAQSLTYDELAKRMASVARALTARGIGRGDRIAVDLAPSCDRLTAVLGILTAGATFVPLDPAHPEERRQRVIEHAEAKLTVGSGISLADLVAEGKRLRKRPEPPNPADIAYIVYTSGSTGTPKGVAVRHGALANLAIAQAERLDLTVGDRLLRVTSPAFDVAIGDLVTAMAAGATLCFAEREILLPGPAFLDTLRDLRITHAQLPASYLAALGAPPELPGLRVVVIGGETIPPAAAAPWARNRRLINAYGPSETTVTATMADVSGDETRLPIGTPLPGVRLYVVDEHGHLLPQGVAGELWIGGCGVADGYVGDAERTAKSFTDDPFGNAPGDGLYRTGDLVRWQTDGQLVFIGRRDTQVKLRGMRIELEEIEAELLRLDTVHEVAADVRGTGPEERLVAWIVAEPSGELPAPEEIKAAVGRFLPSTMVPSRIGFVDALPRTTSGKIDRKALSEPEAETAATAAPRDDLERLVASVWSAVLGRPEIDIHANFFDLGGHSLLVPQVQGRLQAKLGRTIPITDLFRFPTVAGLAAHLGTSGAKAASIAPAAVRSTAPSKAIAVVGMAGRFPGADDVEAFWRMLRDGVEAVTFFDRETLAGAGHSAKTIDDPDYVPARAVLSNVENFDAGFFGYTPREAAEMDPQHRLLLELAWEAMEHAGYGAVREESRRVGVYAGVGVNAYALNNLLPARRDDTDLFQLFIGNEKDFAPTRVAYKLGLKGPAVAINTACSTSLTAVWTACEALRNGDCDMALAGGAAIVVPQEMGYLHQDGAIDSIDGHCRTFDAEASGTISGSGGALVVLKPLDAALADGDTIHAVIRGGAINNDGADKAGFTAPSESGQAAVIGKALADGGVDPRTIGYVEAHGTGTKVGDPIEVAALNRAFTGQAGEPLPAGSALLGSVKSNIGHLDAGAGVSGLVKTVLAVNHGEIPPSLHFKAPNPGIDFAGGPFAVAGQFLPWPDKGPGPRRAGVSSFGIGGTNVHLIVEQAPESAVPVADERAQLLTLSAATPSALETVTERLATYLENDGGTVPLADTAFTLQTGRAPLTHRHGVIARSHGEAIAALRDPARRIGGTTAADGIRVAMLFPGQGSQYPGMARNLYDSEPVFRDVIDRACDHLAGRLEHDLRELLLAAPDDREAADRLRQTAMTQPALFAVEAALAELWRNWGIAPDAMAGHSIGEYVAAWVAEVFSFEDALDLVALRGRLMQDTPPGVMLAVELGAGALAEHLGDGVSLAAVNSPSRSVVAGTEKAMAKFEAGMQRRDIATRRLHTSRAFHSDLMEPVLEPYRAALKKIELRAPAIPFVSNVTGTWITGGEATDPEYWVRHIRQPVLFGAMVETLAADPRTVLLETGPGRTLITLARSHADAWNSQRKTAQSLPGPTDTGTDARETLLAALGRLWNWGARPHWPAVHGEARRRVPLPTYPFERTRHWIDPPARSADGAVIRTGRRPLDQWLQVPTWTGAPVEFRDRESRFWQIVGDGNGLAAALEKALIARGQRILSQLSDANGDTPTIVDLRPLEAAGAGVGAARERAFAGPLQTVRSLIARGTGRYVAVSANTQDVTGTEKLSPEGALVTGLVLALPREHEGIAGRLIDIDSPDADKLADELLAEDVPLVALRGRRRWIPDIAPVTVGSTDSRLKDKGVYAVIGGFGKLGQILANHLAEAHGARLALVGRPAPDRAADRAAVLARVTEHGGEAIALEADISDAAALKNAFDETEEHFGRLDGVISCAGLTGPEAFAPLTDGSAAELAETQFVAKVQGAAALERALADAPLDFCLLFSSMAGRVGGAGLAGYASANAYLDAFVRAHNRGATTKWLCVPWDAWVLPGEPMTPGLEDRALSPEDGCAAFDRVLATRDLDEVLVLPGGVPTPGRPMADKQIPTTITPAAVDPGDRPNGTAEESVAAVFSEVLGHAVIGRHDDFFALGGDSLIAVKVAARLRGAFGREVSVRDVFDAPTVETLAVRLSRVPDVPEAASDREEGTL